MAEALLFLKILLVIAILEILGFTISYIPTLRLVLSVIKENYQIL